MKKSNIIFKLYSKNDFTDNDYLDIRKLDIDAKSFSELLLQKTFESEFSKKLINSFLKFENGLFEPEKVDVYEPISETYQTDKLSTMIDWLSQAGGVLMLKKTKKIKYIAEFKNNRISKIWANKKSNIEFNDPIYISQLTIIFSDLKEEYYDLTRQFCQLLHKQSEPSVAYIYNGKNIDINIRKSFSENEMVKELTKYDSKLIELL